MKYLILVTLLSPIVTHYIKTMLPQLPKKYIPLIAPLLGGIAEGLTRLTVGTDLPQGFGVAAGAAGVAIREVVNQWGKDGSDRIGASCVVALVMATALLGGCGAQQPAGSIPKATPAGCTALEAILAPRHAAYAALCAQAKDPLTDDKCLTLDGINVAIEGCWVSAGGRPG